MPYVRILRAYPWRGHIYRVGASFEVPQAQAERMAAALPPFAEIIPDEKLDELTQPDPPESTPALGETVLTFTAGATELLSESGIGEDDYTGDSDDGRVTKGHVRDWLEKGTD